MRGGGECEEDNAQPAACDWCCGAVCARSTNNLGPALLSASSAADCATLPTLNPLTHLKATHPTSQPLTPPHTHTPPPPRLPLSAPQTLPSGQRRQRASPPGPCAAPRPCLAAPWPPAAGPKAAHAPALQRKARWVTIIPVHTFSPAALVGEEGVRGAHCLASPAASQEHKLIAIRGGSSPRPRPGHTRCRRTSCSSFSRRRS